MTGDEIVVTGISGIFPKSGNVKEFMENLYNKVDMVSEESRWKLEDPEVPKHVGSVDGMEHFDAQFFKVGYQRAIMMEPISRKVLEHAYGAIFDSGNTHATLKGQVVGVFIGSSYSDYSTYSMFDVSKATDSIVSGTSKSMFANRISYWMDGKGPSFSIDNSCVSTAAALEQAYNFIKNGDCDAAVVGGGNLCSYPALTLNIKRTGMLCLDGKTKCFDKNGDGFVRSEAVNVIFLQRAKNAKRVYAEVVYADGGYNLKANDRLLPVRRPERLEKFFNDIYSKIDVDPKDMEYIEASAVALAEADSNEAEAIGNTFYNKKAVKVGSVKSNMGHTEAASGLCSLTKLCLAYYKGQLPANIHLEEPIDAVKNGKVQVLTENTHFNRGYTALNNLSFTGNGYHVILKGHYKKKDLEKYNCNIPRLVCASGREESCVNLIFNDLKSKPIDAEEISLLHDIFKSDIVGHTGRGFSILDTVENSTVVSSEAVEYYSGTRPPLWFVFSGMGSQWVGMGRDLLRIPIFAATIERCQKALDSKGMDLLKILTGTDAKILDSVLNSFVGIGAVQIGLTNILKEMGIEPDYIIGHSLGEAACAYQDNTLTEEQTILSLYSRGQAAMEVELIKGSMAAVGMGYKALVKQCPPEIDIACHNSADSCTISGPAGLVKEFVEELTRRGVFARMVASANIAFHSRYIADVGPVLLARLNDVIKDPKLRSEKWISTSVPKDKWDDPQAKYSSAEYHRNNMMSPVLFEDVLRLIPENAVVVEIAPHGLLQAILKRSLKNCTHVPLTKKGTTDSVKFLLEAVGKLYTCGFNPKVDIFYPKVEYPVSTETPLLSHLVGWEHSEVWPLVSFKKNNKIISPSRNIVFSLQDDDYKFLNGYSRNGINVLPESALLLYVWETLAMYQGVDFRDMSVKFRDIQFHSEIAIKPETLIRLNVMISRGKSTFEVTQENKLIVSGFVAGSNNMTVADRSTVHNESEDDFETEINLSEQDIYKILKMRGYAYRDTFRLIASANLHRNKALMKWTDNWIPFLDSLIQLSIVSKDYNGISKLKFIRELKINTNSHKKYECKTVDGFMCYEASVDTLYGITSCAGVQIEDITFANVPMTEIDANVVESKVFFPYYPTEEVNIKTALKMSLQIILENCSSQNIILTKVITDASLKEFDVIDEVVDESDLLNVEIKTVTESNKISISDDNKEKVNVIVQKNVLQDSKELLDLYNLPNETFILSIEERVPKMHSVKNLFSILSSISNGSHIYILMKKIKQNYDEECYINIKFDDTFSWVNDVFSKLVTTKKVVLVSERQPYCGAIGFVNNLRSSGHFNFSVVIVDDFNAPKFDPNNEFYKTQLQRNLIFNVMKKGQWGSFYYKPSNITQKLKSFALKNLTPGNFNNITWVETPKLSAEKEFAQVCYSGFSMNDCDKMMDDAKNKNETSLLGMDFSGIDKNGDKVMGLVATGSAASSIEVDPDLLWPVPDVWSLEDAATVPLAYVQAYYCLTVRRQLRKGSVVLICDGTCSVGLAAISICMSYNCTVFAIVDSEQKKNYLRKCYPSLAENNIICANGEHFFNILMTVHKAPQFSFVLSFASGEMRQAAMKCVGVSGFFFDFSKHDVYNNQSFSMSYLCQERSYLSINISNVFRPEYSDDRKILQKYIAEGIKSGEVKPLCRMVFSPVEASKALEILSQNKHIGNILVRVRDPCIIAEGLKTIPRLSYSSQDVIVIVCDEKGIGVELADRLVERGARKIVLHMKNITGYVHTKLLTWNKQEVSVKLSSDNLQTEKGSSSFMKNSMNFGKVRAVFIVFDPKHTDNGIKEDFISVFRKQSVVFMNLDAASRNCGDLSHFTVLSRLSQNPSEEYSFSLIERMCDTRNQLGLYTLFVRYESLEEMHVISTNNTKAQTLSALFNVIEASMKLKYTNIKTSSKNKDAKKITNVDCERVGLNALYKTIDTEYDNIESTPIVELPTLLNHGNCNNYLDQNDAHIILMPGFEGRSQIFESAAERLKLRAMSIQLGPDLEGKCIKDIALKIREEIRKKTKDVYAEEEDQNLDSKKREEKIMARERRNKIFYIMGYSFGVNIALELAALFEKEGKTGVVYCLDSSPDRLREIIDNVTEQGTEDQIQDLLLNHIYNLLTGTNANKLSFENTPSFENKLDECLKQMKGTVNYSEQYSKLVLGSAYKRIIIARQYQPDFKLNSQIILMKSSKNEVDDYGLAKYTTKPVKVITLQADGFEMVPNDNEVANIVNKFLDEDDINNFKTKNLCDVYFSGNQ